MSCFARTQQQSRQMCLQIPSGSVWKTKLGFTSTSLTSYNKQNNVFLMHGESPPPFPLPALVQSDWPVVGFPWLQLAVSLWWMGKVGGGCLLPLLLWDVPGTDRHIVALDLCWRTAPPAGTATESHRVCPLFGIHIVACCTSWADTSSLLRRDTAVLPLRRPIITPAFPSTLNQTTMA